MECTIIMRCPPPPIYVEAVLPHMRLILVECRSAQCKYDRHPSPGLSLLESDTVGSIPGGRYKVMTSFVALALISSVLSLRTPVPTEPG